jgi:hypothetical protein
MLSLGSQDAQLADEVAELLVELAADELLPVRLAALSGLVNWAGQYRQRRLAAKQSREEQQQQQQQGQGQVQAMEVDQAPVAQQQQQERQQQQHEAAEADDSDGDGEGEEEGMLAEDADAQQDSVDVREPCDSQQQREQQLQPPDIQGVAVTAAGAAASNNASGQSATSAAASTAASKKPSKPSKKRKGDLPPWGADGIAAGIAALRDSHAQVRHLALQVLALLPPANMQAIVGLLQGLISCCEQHQQLHWQAALAVVHELAQQRTAMVAKSCQNICRLLARAVRGPEGGASVDPSAAATAQHQHGLMSAAAAAPAAAAAAHSPMALELLSELLLATARLKASMLPALQQQVEKQGLVEAAALQPLLAQLDAMRQQRMVALQQQQHV